MHSCSLSLVKMSWSLWHIIHQHVSWRCGWQCAWFTCMGGLGPWGCLCAPFLFIHSQWSEIAMCISALVFAYNRYAEWHHWHVYCWAQLPSWWSACDCCNSPQHSLQGGTFFIHPLKPSSFVKISTSWADSWPISKFYVIRYIDYHAFDVVVW